MAPVGPRPVSLMRLVPCLLLLIACDTRPQTCEAPPPPAEALLTMASRDPILLPNGRALAPVGQIVETGGRPTEVLVDPTGRVAYVQDIGRYQRRLAVVDIASGEVLQWVQRDDTGIGMALTPDGRTLFVSGGNGRDVSVADVADDGTLRFGRNLALDAFPAGLAISPDGATLYVADYTQPKVLVIDVTTLRVTGELATAARPFRLVATQDRLWSASLQDGAIDVVDLTDGALVASIPDLGGPDGLVTDGATVWAALSSSDEVVAYDAQTAAELARTSVGQDVADDEGAPLGAVGPTGLALDADHLYVTLSSDAAIALLDPTTLTLQGRFPAGWSPNSIGVSATHGVVVANMRGLDMGPNRDNQEPSILYNGNLTIVDPATLDLEATTREVAALRDRPSTFYPMSCEDAVDPMFPVPVHTGDETPIKHVVLIVKENKTFDSVLSGLDMDVEADPSKLLFGEEFTPNLHALARRFVVGDNFYTDSEVSAQGHVWLTGLWVDDFMERSWMEDYHGSPGFGRDPVSAAALPSFGSFFRQLMRYGVDFDDYGEVVGTNDSYNGDIVLNHVDTTFPGLFFNTGIQDTEKAAHVADRILKDGRFPPFVYVLLPNDHTNGSGGTPSPEAMVHDNDVGMGLLIDRLSHSPEWASTVVFVVEDDPQTGGDHVDVHRSFVIVASPYAKSGHVMHVQASYPSLFATIEHILGIPPLNRFDALATPMWDAFTSTPDLTPYDHIPSSIPWSTAPPPPTPAAALTEAMDFSAPDRNPLLGETLWWHRKGAPPAGGRIAAALAEGPEAMAALTRVDEDEDEDDGEVYERGYTFFEAWLNANPERAAEIRWERPQKHPVVR